MSVQKTENMFPFLDTVGAMWRLAFPALILIVSIWLGGRLEGIERAMSKMDTHFTNHLQHHQDLEVGYERRLSCIETEIRRLK